MSILHRPHHRETWDTAKDRNPAGWRDYHQEPPLRFTPRAEPSVYIGPPLKPQLEHDASYLAALERAQRLPPGAASGAALQHLVVAADGMRVPERRASSGPSLETRVLAYLRKAAPYPVSPQQLNIDIGKSAAAIGASLARMGRAQRREYRVPGSSLLISQYLHAGLKWPPLPVAAYAVRYAGAWGRDHTDPHTAPAKEPAHAH